MYKLSLLIIFCHIAISCNISVKKNLPIEMGPNEIHNNYMNNGTFNKSLFLKDNSGPWICYKYEKDTITPRYKLFEYDDNYAKEFSNNYYFFFSGDTLIANNVYKIPIEFYARTVDTIIYNKDIYMYDNFTLNSDIQSINFVYKTKTENYIRYKDYCDLLMTYGDTIPYYNNEVDPITSTLVCFPEVLALTFKGYNYYFKKGKPKSNGIVGIPSDVSNRFTVNRTYANCTIEDAVYKLIKDFPKGTMGLLAFSDEPNEKGEIERWFPKKSGFNYGESTEYIWHNKNSVTARVYKHKNSTFVFEFIKKGDDVHVKYWNDVVFPFEDGYEEY